MPTSIDIKPLFEERSCLSLDEIKAYTGKKLDNPAVHGVEAHMASCVMCSDAVEGYMAVPAFDLSSDLGRRGRGTSHWTNSLARGVVVLALGLSLGWVVWYFPQASPDATISASDSSQEEQGVVLYDPEEELAELNQTVELAVELPEPQQVGHASNALISKPATNEETVVPLVRDTAGTIVNIAPQVPNAADIRQAPRLKLKRLPVSNRQLVFYNNLKLVHPSEIYPLISSTPALGGTPADDGTTQDEGILRVKHYSYSELMTLATGAYVTGKHKEAAKLFNLWLSKEGKDVNAQFYVGLCYYNLALYEQAHANFELARNNKIDTFREEATWYSALSHEQVNGLESTLNQYEKISLLGGFYSDRAFKKLNP